MAGVYIYSDNIDLAAEIVGFAKGTGKSAVILTTSSEAADLLKNVGADKVLLLTGSSRYIGNYAKAVAELLETERAELFAVGSTVIGRELAASVAGYLDCAMVSDVRSAHFDGGKLFTEKIIFGGAVSQSEEMSGLGVISIPAGVFEKATVCTCEVTETFVSADARTLSVSQEPIVKQSRDLSKAQKIVCIGLGVNKEDDVQIARNLADAIGAEVGCTRSIAEDLKWLPDYIGITGIIVKPQLYISMGVSGQIQHVFGIRDSKIIVAIDTNEKAPIFRVADYGIVGDLYEVIPMLTEALKK
ncbi:MAG TPA: electron transfer flavoprotein subunit alpha/FixB family protein [Syntrophomonas sp.]|nr:electron transfer flavoprotein subunit alpha/FixB family protein [Syntrophomonas sp.]